MECQLGGAHGWLRYVGGQDHWRRGAPGTKRQGIRRIMYTDVEISENYGRSRIGKSYNQALKPFR